MPTVPDGVPVFPYADKLVHAGSFLVVTILVGKAAFPRWLALAMTFGHGLISEPIQHLFLEGRSGDLADLGANLGGVFAGAIMFVISARRHFWQHNGAKPPFRRYQSVPTGRK